MLTRLYVEAILADELAADLVWEAWNAIEITSEQSSSAWMIIANDYVPVLNRMDDLLTVN